jgi:hypothetical protein
MMLREVLVRRNIPWRIAPNNHLSLCCPFCSGRGEAADTRFRFSINCSNGFALCFNCGWRSRHGFSALQRQLALNDLQIDGEPLEAFAPTPVPRLPDDFQCLTTVASDLDRQAQMYLLGRGVTLDQIKQRRIGVSFVGRYAYRVLFPVRDQGELKGFVGRDFTGQQFPKYLNSVGDKHIYGSGQPSSRIILSEGIFKSLRISRLGTGFSSMALLGNSISELQQEQLTRYGCREVVLWPDPTPYAGRKGFISVAEKLVVLGMLVGVVWPVMQAADEEPLESMRETWRRVEGWSWGLRQRLLGGV